MLLLFFYLVLTLYSKSSSRSDEIVPDLTVKSASGTILTRFPSDLLETSVDPDMDTKRTKLKQSTGLTANSTAKYIEDSVTENQSSVHSDNVGKMLNSQLSNQRQTDDQLTNSELTLDQKAFQITTSTLNTASKSHPASSLEIDQEEDDSCREEGNGDRKLISFSEEYDPEVEAEMVNAYQPTRTAGSTATQGHWQAREQSPDSSSNVRHKEYA